MFENDKCMHPLISGGNLSGQGKILMYNLRRLNNVLEVGTVPED